MARPETCYTPTYLGVIGGMSTQRVTAVTTALVAATLMLSACTTTTSGQATVSELPTSVSTSTTPPRPTSTTPAVDPYAALTEVVQEATLDVSRFWASEGVMVPTRATIVTDQADAPCAPSRDAEKAAQAVAWACDMTTPKAVVVNVANAQPDIYTQFSDVGVYNVAAHEQGHIGLPLLDRGTDTDNDVEERRADCGAGAYFAWVIAGESPTVSVTEDQAGGVAAKMWTDTPARTKAFAHGLVYGLQSCLTY